MDGGIDYSLTGLALIIFKIGQTALARRLSLPCLLLLAIPAASSAAQFNFFSSTPFEVYIELFPHRTKNTRSTAFHMA